MDHFSTLDSLLKSQAANSNPTNIPDVYGYARCMADVENAIAVVSDLIEGTSRIFNGGFAEIIGLSDYTAENSIWERKILSLMSPHEQDMKFIAELRFFHYIRRLGQNKRNYYLLTKLRFRTPYGNYINILHRMYYIHSGDNKSIRYALCLYSPLHIDFKGQSIVVNSITGISEELTASADSGILSVRERQILSLISSGMKSIDIAEQLHISRHTVSRHRQDILAKLHVKNSIEACRLARSMELI